MNEESGLRSHAVRGMKLVGLATILVFALNISQNIVLGRLLSPREFGLVGMIWVFLGLAQLFADSGLSVIVIREQDLDELQNRAIFWINVCVTSALGLLAWAASPLLAWFYNEPSLSDLAPLAALSFVISSLGQPFRSLAQKELQFTSIGAADFVSAVASFALALYLAMNGSGVYSLLYSSLAASSSKTLILAAGQNWRSLLVPNFRWSSVRKQLKFGGLLIGERLANYIWSNVDYLLIGRLLGSGPLGLYRMAYEMAVRPLGVINPVFNSVAFPLFAKRQADSESLRRGYLELIELLASLVLPIMTGLFLIAKELILLLFGPAWSEAIPVFRILCLLGVLRSLQNPVGNLLLSKGLYSLSFRVNFATLVITLAVYPFAILWGGLVALSASAVAILLTSILYFWKPAYIETVGLSLPAWIWAIRWSLLSSLVMALGLSILPFYSLPASIGIGAFLYTGTYWIANRSAFTRIILLLRSKSL